MAADACPAGTWVCREDEVIHCNTARPDSTADGAGCDGSAIDWPEENHVGWIDAASIYFIRHGVHLKETDDTFAASLTCYNFAVWCCWE